MSKKISTPRAALWLATVALWQLGPVLQGNDLYWDSDLTAAGNLTDGSNLGGAGTWDTTTASWWDLTNNIVWPNTSAGRAIFTGAFSALPVASAITVDAGGVTTNQIRFNRSGYSLSGGAITLAGTTPTLFAGLGESAALESLIAGVDGLVKTGGGTIRLTNALNSYTGTTNIEGGSLVITSAGALGASTSAINVTAGNGNPSNTTLLGLTGGALVLDGLAGGIDLTRDLNLEGRGPIGDRGAALLSYGNNTLSGVVTGASSTQLPATFRSARLTSGNGMLTLSGTLNVLGTAGTTFTTLGANNQAGNSSYNLTGALTGTGTLQKTGGGTLFLNPSDTSGFSGRIRLSGSAAIGQSSVRVSDVNVFGTANGATTNATIDLDGGILEIRSDAGLNFAKNVYLRASSTLSVDHAIGGIAQNGIASFGNLSYEDNQTFTFNSRNGYGASFTTAPVNGGDNQSTFTNNMGGPLTFTGNFWSNADNAAARTLTIGGNGNTVIDGGVIAASAAFDHVLTKSGSGLLSITGTNSTLDGAVNITGGGLAIGDFRAVTNNTNAINIGSGGTGAALIISGGTPTLAGLTTSKVINLAGTTGGASLYANQTGTNPVVLNAAFTASGAGVKALTLGGSNTAENIINGAIVNNSGTNTTALNKIGSGTWVLAGANTFTGATTLSNGTLKLRANGAVSTTLPSTNAITFNTNSVYAGATLELVGQNGVNNVQTLGALTSTAGSNTIKLTPGAGGTASLVFASLAAPGAGSGLNIVGADFTNNTVTINGANGLLNRAVYFDGADFAYRDTNKLRAPVYGTDAGFATTAVGPLTGASNQEVTGAMALDAAISVNTLKLNGTGVDVGGAFTLTVTSGGVLSTGGANTITATTLAAGAQSLMARVNTDSLTIGSIITGSAGLTKNGPGTLILSGENAQTGAVSINEGTIQLSGTGRLGAANADLVIRQGAVLDLNGVTPSTATSAFNSNGSVTSATPATFTIGGATGTGSSFGTFDGALSVTKTGTGAQSWLGLSTYTGVTTIGSTGLVTVDTLANIGQDSGIGRGDATSAATNAASLVFNGSTGGLVYRGDIVNGILSLGSRSATTDRLFTLAGTGATLSSNQTTNLNNSIVWSNTGAIVHGVVGPQALTFTGGSQGDNMFVPQLTDSGVGLDITSVTKTGTGIWHLGAANNTYSGSTTITQGILGAKNGEGLSLNSNLVFDGGTLYSSGTFNRNIGTGAGEMRFLAPAANTAQFSGGFLGGDSKLTVNWAGTPIWGGGAGFIDARDGLLLNGSQARAQGATGSIALSEVDIAGNFSLGTASATGGAALGFTLAQNSATVSNLASTAGLVVGQSFTGTNVPSGAYIVSINSATQITLSANTANTSGIAGNYTDGTMIANTLRSIRVDDNGNTGADFATISGVISAEDAVTGIRKLGGGTLRLTGANTYGGETNVNQGGLTVTSLGQSGVLGTSSAGAVTVAAFDNSNAVTLGNGGTGGATLQYVGAGETSDRKIRLNSTTGSTQIHADGSGPLVLTNVANDMAAGAKTFFLRGTNMEGNRISSVLADNGGALGVQVDGGATWILTGANTYTGTTTAGGGSLGIGNDSAIGTGGLTNTNGNIFAYGADRTLANVLTLGNNATNGWQGDYSLAFSNPTILGAAANNVTTSNSIVAGKTLTLNGVTANALTANRSWAIEGPGETVINGNVTTSTAFGVRFDVNGGGTLTLGTSGAGSNWSQSGNAVDVDRGTLKFTADNAIPTTATSGAVILSPELAVSDTATLNLNGTTQTVNALTATTDGAVLIDNTSGTAATFRFGANNTTVNLNPATTGARTITDSGAGALSIVKLGTTTTTLNAGMNLTYQGTTSAEAGTFIINSDLAGSTGLLASGGSTLILNGALATSSGNISLNASGGSNVVIRGAISQPNLINNVSVGLGSSLNLINGGADQLTSLTSLNLGGVGAGLLTIGLDIGANTAASDTLTLAGAATTLGAVQFNLGVLPGFGSSPTYDLISATSGLAGSTYNLGFLPGGFTYNLTSSDTLVQLGVSALAAGDLYWRGGVNTSWASIVGGNSNFTTDLAGAVNAGGSPGTANTVVFSASSATGPSISTFLNTPYTVDSVRFSSSPTGVTAVSIAPGALATNSLTLSPASDANGITIQPNSGVATISAPLVLGANQTWTVDGTGGSGLTVSGGVSGAGNLTIAASNGGLVTLSGTPVAPLTPYTGTTTVTSGAILRSGAANTLSTASAFTIASGGTLRLNGFANAIGSLSGAGTVENESTSAAVLTVGALGDSSLFSGVIRNGVAAGALGVTKVGTGTLELSGANSYTGTTLVSAGTLVLSGARTGASGAITVGSLAATNAELNITAGTYNLAGNSFTVGNSATTAATGTVNQSGGGVSFTGGSQVLIGNVANIGNTGIYNLSGGTLTTAASTTTGVRLGINTGATGIFNLSGTGSLQMTTGGNSVLAIGRSDVVANNTTNTFNQTGGTAAVGTLAMGGAATAGSTGVNSTLNLTGGTFVANTFTLLSAGNTNSSSIIIGGTADVTLPAFPTVRGTGSTATLTLDGGTLRPLASSASYLGGLTNAFLTSNGASINVATGVDITVSQVLENAPSQTGTLLKLGAGRLALTGVNSFTGAVTVNGGELSVTSGALANISGLSVGVGGNGSFDLYADGIASTWNVPTNSNITLSSASTTGGLGFDLGTLGTSDKIVFTGTGALTVDAAGVGLINARGLLGFGAGSYELISGPNNIANISNLALGVLPGGFTYSLDLADPTKVLLNVLAAAAGDLYWRGDASTQSWANIAGGNTNWATDAAGLTEAGFTPAPVNTVNFSANNAGGTPIVTTLDSLYSVQGLKILNSGTGSVSIAPGVGGVLTVGVGGIEVQAGAPVATTISAPVVLGSNQNWTVTDAASVLTSSGGISGTADLTKEGLGTLTLSGTQTYVGTTTVNGGKLRAGAALGFNATSAHILGAAGTLELNGFNQTLPSLAGSAGSVVTNGAAANAVLTVGDATNTTFAGELANGSTGTLGLTKVGTGTLTLSGVSSNTGNTTVNAGILAVTGTFNNGVGTSAIGSAAGSKGVLYVPAGGSYSSATYTIGANATGVGSIVVNGGALSATTPTVSAGLASIGGGGYGGLFLNGGTITTPRLETGTSITAASVAVVQVAGGTLTTTGDFIFFRNGNGEFTIRGGSVVRNNPTANISLGETGIATTMTLAGGSVNNTGRSVEFGRVGSSVSFASLNLNAGSLTTDGIVATAANITGAGAARVNFNGGELIASANNTSFLPTGVTAAYSNGAFGTFAGGAVVNSNGFNIGIQEPILAPTGNGIASLSVGSAGSGYIGAPFVQITGGGGTGATGYAVVDLDPDSGTYGQVTNVVITNPGVGYTSTPTINLLGGGGTGAVVNASGPVANVSGGLTKTGEGILTLSGVNTFTGGIAVNGGRLHVTGSNATSLPVNVNGGAISFAPTALANVTTYNIGATQDGALDLLYDNVAANWTVPSGITINLGGATSAGGLGFNLGSNTATSDQMIFSPGSSLVLNAGGGRINGSALGTITVGSSYDVITGATITGLGSFEPGTLPSGYTYNVATLGGTVTLNVVGQAAAGDLYWKGGVNTAWGGLGSGGTVSNWSTTADGLTGTNYGPGANNLVIFSADAIAAPAATTLDSAVSVQGVRFLSTATPVVNILPGALGSLNVGSQGIEVQTGAQATTTISAPVGVSGAQTWTVADTNSLLNLTGVVSGGTTNSTQAAPGSNVALTITGAGTVSLSGSANTFAGDILVDGGGLTVNNDRSWGGSTAISSTSKTVTLINGGRLSVVGTVNPGGTTTTNYNLLRVGAGGATIDTVLGATYSMDDAGQFGTVAGANITKSGPGVLMLGADYGALIGENTAISVTGGILRLQTNVGAFGTTNKGLITLAGGDLDLRLNEGGNFGNNVVVTNNATISTGRTTAAATNIDLGLGTLSIGAVTLTQSNGNGNTAPAVANLAFEQTTLTGSPTFNVTNVNGAGVGTLTLGSMVESGGSYGITKTGAGALAVTGSAAYTGPTTVTGGRLSIFGQASTTGALTVTGSGSVLALRGGFATPSGITSINVGGGSTLNLLDGTRNALNVDALTLGSTGGTITTLSLDVGDLTVAGDNGATDLINLKTGGLLSLITGNQVFFDLSDVGLNANQQYNLLSSVDGGLTTGALGTLDWLLANTPGGFTSFTINRSDNLISVTTGDLITGNLYWRGQTDTVWNGNVNNWTTDKAGTLASTSIPGTGNDVLFQSDAALGGAVTTTLGQNFRINSLTFESSTNIPASVTINPGTVSTNRLDIAGAQGITLAAGGPGTVTIGTGVKLGADQTWTVADSLALTGANYATTQNQVTVADTSGLRPGMVVSGPGIPLGTTIASITNGTQFVLSANTTAAGSAANLTATSSLNVTGVLSGGFNLTKAGNGVLVLANDNPLYTGVTTIAAGSLQVGNGGSTGNLGTGNIVNNATLEFNRTGSHTVDNLISGTGTLSKRGSSVMVLGNNSNTFSGPLVVNAGVVEFATVSNIGGGPSSLGQDSTLTLSGGTLRFTGNASQATDRVITTTTTGSTIANNGVGGASLTFNGLIVNTGTATGDQLTLTGLPGNQGFIRGGISQTLDAADLTVNGGTWHHELGVSRIGDDLTLTGGTTILNLTSGLFQVRDDFTVTAGATLNLNANPSGEGVLSFNTTTLSADATLRATAGGVINLEASDAVNPTQFDQLRIGTDAGGPAGVFNMNAFNQTVTELHLGNRNLDRTGTINGTGTLTVLGNVDLYKGEINANLASSGTAAFDKIGATGTVTLKGDNSALTSTGASAVYAGTLILDYTESNTVKLRELSNLDMRGGTLQVRGNNSAATTQTVATLTLGEGGASVIEVDGGTGQEAVLNFGGLTRATNANDGTIRFILPSGVQSATNGITTTATLTNGMLGLSGFATVDDGTGTYFATTSGSNVVGLVSTPKNDVTTWATGEHITDETTGFTGTLAGVSINSLRFNAAAGSDLNINTTGVLGITSGGILVTNNVGGTPGIFGGTLTSGAIAANVPELIVTQDSTQMFEISSAIGTNHAITKSGNGTLRLSGNNFYTGYTDILQGTLEVGGGNAIGDTSLVILDDNRNTTLRLLSNETIGRLQGGRRNDGEDNGTVDLGANTLSLNQSAITTYSGVFTGTGTLVMNAGNTGHLNYNGQTTTGFTGAVIVNGGLFQISGDTGRLNAATAFTINGGGNLLLDNDSDGNNTTRISDSATFTLNSASGTFSGQTIVRGLAIRNNDNDDSNETIGATTFNSGTNYFSLEASGGSSSQARLISNTGWTRNNAATLNVRGRSLGATADAAGRTQFKVADANDAAMIAANVGGGGAIGTAAKNVSIVPWAIGQSLTGALAATDMGNTFLTYVDNRGLVALSLTDNFSTFAGAGGNTDNVRESLTGSLALPFGPARTVNSLVLHNNSVAAATHDLTGLGAGESLAVTSGALLFTLNPAAVAGEYGLTLGGFGNGITVGAANEYVIHVVNPDAGVPTKALTATISSSLTSGADITKAGRGTLILSGTNTAGGGVRRTTINEGVLQIDALANIGGTTGNLVFAGGTLRLGTGFAQDLSTRTISFLNGGGTLDTNGNDVSFAGSLGSGVGGFTKVGVGNLTLNAAATYTGPTVLSAGTITVGASNALGVGGDLTLAGGTTLALGANSLSSGLVTVTGLDPVITGTGTITAANGFFFNNTTTSPATTNVDAVLAGAGGLRKAQANTLVLNGLNTYSGPTEIQAGAVTFNTIGNVGGGASGLGAPTTVANGILRLGLTTANVVLNYTGIGHSSDRVLGMQGTTGGLTLNANGSGAVGFGVVTGLTFGAKTLTLDGTADASLMNSINGVVEGAGTITLVKNGTTSWAITGAGTHSGLTTVNGGVLRISNSTALGAVTAGTVVAEGATLQLEGGITVGAEALTISGAGAAGQTGALVNLGGSNSFAGAITALSPLTISSEAGALALGALTGVDFGLTLVGAGDVSFGGDVQLGNGAITKNGAGLLALAGNNSFTGGLALNAGTVEAGSAGALGTAGPITFGGGTLRHGAGNTEDYSARFVSAPGTAYRIETAGQTVTYAAPLSGAGSTLTKSGAGTLVLSAVNTFDGQTAVTGGALSISSEDNLGAAPAAFTADQLLLDNGTLLSTASFAINDANRGITLGALGGTFNTAPSTQLTLDSPLAGVGQLTKDGAGTLLLNVVSTHTGGTVVQDGTLLLGVSNAITGAVTVSGAGALDIGANSLTVSSLNVAGSSASITGTGSIDSAAGFGFSPTGPTTISSVLAGSGGVTMNGTGTAILKGANTYAGPTTISSGALLLDGGSIASTGTVSVASAATFGGIGSVQGPVVLAAGTGYQLGEQSLLNVGGGVRDGLNVLDLNGDLTTGNFSILDFYLTRTGFTQLDVAGAMNLDAGTRIRINLDSGYIPNAGSAFDLLNWGSLNIGGGASLADLLFPLPTDGMGAPVWVTTDFNTLGILRVDGVRTGPAITTDPVGGVVLAGESVTFTLGVTGSDPLVIQWYKGPTTANPIAGANGLTYTIPAVAGADSGQYWARVTNGPNPEDTVDSQLATLDVVTVPRITVQPTGATLFPSPGTNKTFNVTAIGPGTLNYVWRKATVAIPGAPNDDEYTINGVQVADSGNYTVTVSNSFGSVTSEVAVLTVNAAIEFTQQPQTPTPAVPEGNEVTLTAAVIGEGPFTYQWERAPRIGLTGSNFGPFAPVNGQMAPTITQLLDLTTQGKYRLVVSNAYTTLTSNEATVIFGAAQVVVTTPPVSKIVAVGSTLTLDVGTSGGKPQKFQWFFKGKAVGDETDSTLRIEDVTSARAGPYFCRISNALVSGSTQADTQVVYVSVVDRKPGRFVLTQPGTVSLSVTATSDTRNDPLTYQWYVDEGLVSTPTPVMVPGATARTYKATNLTAGRKRFFCRVSAGTGSRSLDGGDNLVFIYTQPPALQPEGSWNLPDTVVSQPYSYQVPMVDNPLEAGQPNPLSMPVSFRATGLPPGLTINSAGLISGRATVERRDKVTKLVIPYTVTITATNKLGTTTPIIKNLLVNPLDVGLIGAFTGPVDRNSSLNGNLGGVINFTTSKTGTYSGKLTMGAKTFSFKGALNSVISDPTNPSVTVKVSRGTTLRPLLVSFKLNSAGFVTGPVNPLTRGTITDGRTVAQFDGWRNTWLVTSTNKTPALAYSGYYTMGLDIPLPLQGTATNPTIPQGTGYAAFTVSSSTGKMTVSGRLADGTAFTTATYAGPTGEVLVFKTLYSSKTLGSVVGQLKINQQVALDTTDNTLDGTVSWWKPTQAASTSTTGRTYAAGFGPFDLSVVGSRYVAPLKGFPVMDLAPNATTNNARLSLVEANSEAALPVMTGSPANTVAVRVDNANKVFPDVLNNPRKVSMKITSSTGLVSFKFSLSQPHPFNGSPSTVARSVAGVGIIVNNGVDKQAWGYFLLPQLPSSFSEKTTATPILSGQAVFEKIP